MGSNVDFPSRRNNYMSNKEQKIIFSKFRRQKIVPSYISSVHCSAGELRRNEADSHRMERS